MLIFCVCCVLFCPLFLKILQAGWASLETLESVIKYLSQWPSCWHFFKRPFTVKTPWNAFFFSFFSTEGVVTRRGRGKTGRIEEKGKWIPAMLERHQLWEDMLVKLSVSLLHSPPAFRRGRNVCYHKVTPKTRSVLVLKTPGSSQRKRAWFLLSVLTLSDTG